MSDQRVRWGILGTGKIAGKFVSDLPLVPGAELAAVGSRTQASAEKFAAEHGAARAHGSWDALAADPDVDVVYIATPHIAHVAATTLCLEAGKAVLVEKPMALDRPAAQRLTDLAAARGVFLMEAMWMRCHPGIRAVRQLVADGAIGDVTAVHADFGLAGPFEPTHRLRDRALGGGALLDLGIYPVNIAHLVLGAPSSVQAWARLTPEGVDATTGILLGHDSGAVAALTCGIEGESRNQATITGTAGRIELPTRFHYPEVVTVHRTGRDPEVLEFPVEGWGYHFEAAEVQRCVLAGERESPLVPHAATLEVLDVMDRVRAQVGVVYEP
ncbi:Gfo/Idh/MocA family protein [Spirilliplanes yamanashiensis]|uniref:Oxidoreductase n=1 Tax=Spirilliplanes yamanashiensis TaxID=42233 RepID=A0A8J4DHG3_9ACTN|nr:Gfo/Idh/MocA family oxidoreductase [Spirilliplanes yamanashiensis]MDP9814461.1 putative dehydrogenase [Spirilliplanes yamanashiensis]GIJ02112.1 oxidoreductase [Spirilliplanes yamanashiensis]